MKQAKQLLLGLLDYIGEQAKLVSRKGFQLARLAGLKYGPFDLAGLAALRFNLNEAGEGAWLRM